MSTFETNINQQLTLCLMRFLQAKMWSREGDFNR